MQNVPAFRGRLSFNPCISKTFQIFSVLSVNFKKCPYVDFFDDMSQISIGVPDDWNLILMTHLILQAMDQNAPCAS
jgi:hypothetical protein